MRFLFLILATLYFLAAAAQTDPSPSPAWQRFRTELSGHSVYGLGEGGHGYESINAAKGRFLDFLRRQLGVSAVVFESSFTLSAVAYLSGDSLEQRLTHALYPFWTTPSVAAALRPFYGLETDKGPLIAGCDVQEDCRFTRLSRFLLHQGLVGENVDRLRAADSILAYYIGKDFSRRSALSGDEYSILCSHYEAIAAELKAASLPAVKHKLLLRALENRKWLCRYLTLPSARQRMYYRDSVMAENVKWLTQECYLGAGIALWAANTHIAGLNKENTRPQWMGEWLSAYFKEAYYPLSFQKGSALAGTPLEGGLRIVYASGRERFRAVVSVGTLKKIAAGQWVTACE